MGKHLGKFMEKKSRELTIDSQEFLPKVKKKKAEKEAIEIKELKKRPCTHTHTQFCRL